MSKKSGRERARTKQASQAGRGKASNWAGGSGTRGAAGKKGAAPKHSGSGAGRRGFTVAVVAVVLVGLLATGGILGIGYLRDKNKPDSTADIATIETTKGIITVELYPKLEPNTVANFEDLALRGFYDGCTWWRVEDWVVQTGDPTGTGRGGSEQTIPLETNANLKNVRGAVGMARTPDPNSATSQFYILKVDSPSLDPENDPNRYGYAVFGMVTGGMDVVDQLTPTDKIIGVRIVQAQTTK